jgi:hypothetical protein
VKKLTQFGKSAMMNEDEGQRKKETVMVIVTSAMN